MRYFFRGRKAQLIRRFFQVSVLVFVIYAAAGTVWRNYKMAHNNARIVSLLHGDVWGTLYQWNNTLLGVFGDPFQESLSMLGMPWSGTLFGLNTADPLLVVTTMIQTRELSTGLLLALILPVLMAVIFGKIFCSYLCPMRLLFELGQGIRKGLSRLGIDLPNIRGGPRFSGWVMLGGILAGSMANTGIWLYILPYVSFSAGIFLLITAGFVSAILGIAIFWFMVDVFLAPGYFCHHLCPTGFVLEQLGRRSWFQLSKRTESPCPSSCRVCIDTCPYGLSPRDLDHKPACNNCGICVTTCPSQKLFRAFRVPFAVLLVVGLCPDVHAHHNKGLPHYGYFENYPQVPTDEYVVIQGIWEMGASIFNFQGLERRDADTPNDIKMFLYIFDLEKDTNYKEQVLFEIQKGSKTLVVFERDAVDEESVYSTRETLPESGDYQIAAHIGGKGGPVVIMPFHVDLAQDTINWWLLGAILLPVVAAFGLALMGRRRFRTLEAKPPKVAKTAVLICLLLWWPGLSSPLFGQTTPSGESTTLVSQSSDQECASCGMINCTMDHYQTQDGGEVMVMGGIPRWLFLLGIVAVLVISFVAVEWFGAKPLSNFRRNLIKKRKIYNMVRSRWFQAVPQLAAVAVLLGLLYAGLFGSRVQNITPIAVWTIWWAGLIFAVALLGPLFCFACPWDGLANLASRLRIKARVQPLTMAFPFPKILKTMFPAIALFVGLTWLELGMGVTTNPRTTAYMGLGMAALAIVAALIWDGKVFCHYACPVGRISGIYANFSPVEIRARNPRTCQKCTTEDCLHGNERGYACPTGLSLKTIENSTYCTMCTECIKSCDKYNVAFNIRPFAADLHHTRMVRPDEAWMCLILLSLTLFHGLSMTPVWENFKPGGASILKWMAINLGTGKTFNFTLAMILIMALPVLLYWVSCVAAAAWTKSKEYRASQIFLRFSFSLLPVALFYHLAHNAMHLLMEGGEIVPMLSDPMGGGSNFLGTADLHVGSLIPEGLLWYVQVGLILIGHLIGILVAHRIGHSMFAKKDALKALLPMLIMMIVLSVCGLGLMAMDMNMRVGRM